MVLPGTINMVHVVLPLQPNFEKVSKNCTHFSNIQKYKNLTLITVTLLMIKQQKSM